VKFLLLIAAVGAVGWWLTRSRCRHLDERGASLLQITWIGGRMRGWCPDCERLTRGWAVPEPQYTRLPRARKVVA
jgi:hypothetical protein